MGRITVKVHLDLDSVMTFFGGRVNCGKKRGKTKHLNLEHLCHLSLKKATKLAATVILLNAEVRP